MSKFRLKIFLGLFKSLMAAKKALLYFFSLLSVYFLLKTGRFLTNFFIFPFYKLYLKHHLRGGRIAQLFLSRKIFYFAILLMGLFLFWGESQSYGLNKYLSGRESLLFAYLGPGEEGDFLEEETVSEMVLGETRPSLGIGVSSAVGFGEAVAGLEEIAGFHEAVAGLSAPFILPGVEIGGRRQIIKYAVQPGDALASLARKFKISLETILIENKLSARSLLRPGDVLTILPISGVSHKIKKGDTLKKIAASYKADEGKIKEFNNLNEGELPAGEIILIPEGRMPLVSVPRPISQATGSGVPRPPAVRPFVSGMLWPTTTRRITQYFTWRHPGIDIALPVGNPIYASDDGLVEKSGWNRGGYGNMAVVNHGNGLKTRYAHASKLFVQAGEEVKKGDVIGLIGSTGRSTGAHLHFEVLVGGVRVNPFLYVR
ncbi:MAG: M23 family metallopeptidase [Candidatus Magasanikbacteria bacterium]|nr:M23 family metallopeptidase [Candidatus Magasanikbacteria bacterium]